MRLFDMKRLAAAGRMSRRDFVQLALAAGITAASANSMFSAALASTPKRGGRLRSGHGHGSTTDNYDPSTYTNFFVQGFINSLANMLTVIEPDGSLAGELAESWSSSPDAKVWTFKLRNGVTFHNGKSLDAEDVIASLNYHRAPDSKSAAKAIVKPITDIKADGKDTVVVTLEDGNADFPFLMSGYHLAIYQAKDGKPDFNSGIGTGGYIVENWEPGVRALLKRNPNYFKPDRAWFDEVEMLTIADVAARVNALSTGAVDVADRVDLKTVHLLKANPAVRIEQTTGTQHYTFAMNTTVAPFDNNDVRMALKLGIDRQEILDKVLFGYGKLGNDHPIATSNRFHASEAELPQRSYDPDRAKYHLKKAGMEQLDVQLSVANAAFAGAVDAGILYKEKAARAGINLDVLREADDGYWSKVWMKKPWSAVYWGGRPTEDWMFTTVYSEGAAWNDTFWSHERFNRLLKEARSMLDEAKRRELYVEMQRIVSNEGGVVLPMFASYVFATSTKIAHGEKLAANWDLDGMRFIERWWFA